MKGSETWRSELSKKPGSCHIFWRPWWDEVATTLQMRKLIAARGFVLLHLWTHHCGPCSQLGPYFLHTTPYSVEHWRFGHCVSQVIFLWLLHYGTIESAWSNCLPWIYKDLSYNRYNHINYCKTVRTTRSPELTKSTKKSRASVLLQHSSIYLAYGAYCIYAIFQLHWHEWLLCIDLATIL